MTPTAGKTAPRCLGVTREQQNSPNRQADDALILRAVLSELEARGVAVSLISPEQFDEEDLSAWDLVIPMCESYPRLRRLQLTPAGTLVINRASAVLNCYRALMVPLLAACPQVVFPPSRICNVEQGPGSPPDDFAAPDGWWIKRGDVHNTCDHDVVRIREWADMPAVLQDFRSREITHYVVQPHIGGDLIKFYGVGPGRWFIWFYHNPSQVQGLPFNTEDLSQVTVAAAAAVGLEVFGGDAIVGPDKRVVVIDINSWPSFAKVRGGAAPHIADHLHSRLQALVSSHAAAQRLSSPGKRPQ